MAPVLRAPTGLRKFSSMSMEAKVTASRRLAAKLLEISQSTREEPASGQGEYQSDDRGSRSACWGEGGVPGYDLIDPDSLGSPEQPRGSAQERTKGHIAGQPTPGLNTSLSIYQVLDHQAPGF